MSSLGKYALKKGKFRVKCSKYAQICPKKVILCQNNRILAKYEKYAQSSWAHFTQNFLNRKRNIDMLKHLQPEKYAKAYFAFP